VALVALVFNLIQTERALGQARRGNRLNAKQNARSTRRAIAGAAETQSALAAADRTAVAAERSAKLDRAWMTAGELVATIIRDEGAEKIQVMQKWQNTGRSPAIKLVCATRFMMPVVGTGPIHVARDDPGDVPRFIVGAGQHAYGTVCIVGREMTAGILARTHDLHFYNWVEYSDVFDPHIVRRTEAYFLVYIHRGENGLIVTQSQPIGLQNTIT
jgi:hypothetical protein